MARGTASTDVLSLLPTSGIVQLQSTVGGSALALHVPLVPTALQELWLDALAGDDVFSVDGPQPYTGGIVLLGGSPSASDVAYLTGDGSDVTYITGFEPQAVFGGGLGTPSDPLQLLGVEVVNLSALGGSITINGTPAPNAFDVSPTGINTATTTVAGINQVLNTTNSGVLLLAEGNADDGDAVTVHGTAAGESITVERADTTIVTVATWKPVSLTASNIESLTVAAGPGDDAISVSGTVGPAYRPGRRSDRRFVRRCAGYRRGGRRRPVQPRSRNRRREFPCRRGCPHQLRRDRVHLRHGSRRWPPPRSRSTARMRTTTSP